MSKRGVSFADNVETRTFTREELLSGLPGDDVDEKLRPATEFETDDDGIPLKKKGKHTLDSDEEDNDDHQELDMQKVDGQEDCDLDFDGTTKITAFNMKEDMEEGHFDSMGNFIFNKKEKEIHDAWLDDIDWAAIKKKAGDQWEKGETDADDEAPSVLTDTRRREIYTELLSLLKPELTISRALADIKKKKNLSAAEERKLRWAAKKAGKALEQTDEQKETAKLSSLADELISAGHMDAYEWTRERIEQMLKKMDATAAADSLDMFSDEPTASSSSQTATTTADDEVKWEYKESEEGEITGPFTSAEMAARQEKGELAAKGLARKIGSGGFNPVARIDFDLYC